VSLSLFEEVAPPYVRPSLASILERPRNGLRAVGSFSGCGGSSLGLKMAGWDVLAAVEFIPAAAETYRANFPGTRVYEEDVRALTAERILTDLGLERGELDLFEGAPPCASFSPAGSRERHWGEAKKYSDTRQRTDDLFFKWVRLLEGLAPRAFIAENVPGMITGSALEEYAWKVTRLLSEKGYRVSAKVLNAANYGVPQERRRLIFVGFRDDVDVDPWEWPRPTTPVPFTLRQALEEVRADDPDHTPEFLAACSMERYAVGRTWEAYRGLRDWRTCVRCDRPLEEHSRRYKDGKTTGFAGSDVRERETYSIVCADGETGQEVKDYFVFGMPQLDRPCLVITATAASAGAASVVHPTECRKFTPGEGKSISGFPPDFVLTGTREQRSERIGRAVPPPLFEVLGRALAERLS
jgi:DNA (cytosine-5)-methyltransferase 1